MSFINPLFLIAISAAVLPVLFHFVRKMRAKKVPFGSLMFLKATPKELIKKRRLRDLLLLAIRAAMFALLALAFARPFLPQEQLPFLSQREDQSIVLLIDHSYSMQAGDLLDQAKQAALDRLDAAEGNDEFAIIAFADDVQQLTPLDDDLALHRNVIDALDASNRATDFYNPLRRAAEVLQDARHTNQTVVLISDFQRGGWTGALDNWKLDNSITFIPVKIGGGEVNNAYVEAFDLTKKRTGSQVALRYDARVAAQGASVEQSKAASLILDGQTVEQKTLPATPTSQVTFQQRAAREGFFQGALTLGDDDLLVDNQYYFTYDVAARPSLLVVDEGGRGRTDAFFLRNAFALGETALYDFETGGTQRLSRSGLRGQNVVFIANVGSLTGTQTAALRAYVEEGGSVVLSFGQRTNVQALSSTLQTLGIGTARDVVSARSLISVEAIIGEVDWRHPIFEPLASSGSAILRPAFRRYVRVEPDSGAVVLGRYDTGDPFLLERRLGRGKVLVYTSTFSMQWTNLSIDELFVPFVYQLAKYGLSTSDTRRQFTVGEVVPLIGAPGAEWDVRTPDGNVFKVTNDSTGTGFFREVEVPGHYVAVQGSITFPFSVNVDSRESVLEARDEEEVYASVVAPSDEVAKTPEAAALIVEDAEKEQKLWRYLIFLVIGLFVLETVLANRVIGTKRVRAT
ncbi:MAG TPA: VWA domain-containing protein [Rhodothermales bacterium]|nr:VWA domain-containing protein [Rhodothermales bacterium]